MKLGGFQRPCSPSGTIADLAVHTQRLPKSAVFIRIILIPLPTGTLKLESLGVCINPLPSSSHRGEQAGWGGFGCAGALVILLFFKKMPLGDTCKNFVPARTEGKKSELEIRCAGLSGFDDNLISLRSDCHFWAFPARGAE